MLEKTLLFWCSKIRVEARYLEVKNSKRYLIFGANNKALSFMCKAHFCLWALDFTLNWKGLRFTLEPCSVQAKLSLDWPMMFLGYIFSFQGSNIHIDKLFGQGLTH